MKKEMNNKGFSLVELIIVIAIMAVLMGILAPQYLKYVKQSKISTDVTNAEEIATAVNTAIADSVNTDPDSVAFSSGATLTGGTALIKNSSSTVKASVPDSKVKDASGNALSWVVTYDNTNGVTKITLAGKEIWPTSKEYESWAKANGK